MQDMMREIDEDGSGTIDLMEFMMLMTSKVKDMKKEDEINESFKILDKEQDDFLSVKELKYFMRKVAHIKLSNEEAEAMIKYADSDNDGLVSFNDFKALAVELSDHFSGLKVKHIKKKDDE
jgi:calmodulin